MQVKLHMVTIEDLVPGDHFLRKLEMVLDLSFVYEETKKLYCHRYGRPPIDPVILVKYLLVGYLYGIPSERQIEQRIQTDVALRWYLGLDLFDRVPDHSTISQVRRRKPSFRKIFRRLFEQVVEQCIQAGLVSGKLVVTDSTHVKANASRASEHLVEAVERPGAYWERLDAYEEEGLEELERKVPDTTVTSGEVHDAVPYLKQLEYIHYNVIPIQAAAADAAYDFPLFHHVLRDHNIRFYVRPMPRSAAACDALENYPFSYDEENDIYTCPNGNKLRLRSLNRSTGGLHWMYFSDKKDCDACPLKARCIGNRKTKFPPAILSAYFVNSPKC